MLGALLAIAAGVLVYLMLAVPGRSAPAAASAARIRAFNATAGLARTTPSLCVNCPGFPWPGWGLTTTVPADQIALLRELVEADSLLTSADRRYAFSLMEDVTPSQRWGVSGGVPPGVTVALKNRWLPLNGVGTDWQITASGGSRAAAATT